MVSISGVSALGHASVTALERPVHPCNLLSQLDPQTPAGCNSHNKMSKKNVQGHQVSGYPGREVYTTDERWNLGQRQLNLAGNSSDV
jgi:hypothetical protein